MRRRFLTLEQAVAMVLEESDDEAEAEITILPPEDNPNVSDNEDIDDNDLGEVLPADVCGELEVTTKSTMLDDEESEIPKPVKRLKKTAKNQEVNWKKRSDFDVPAVDIEPKSLLQVNPNVINQSPFEIFLSIFDESYLEHLTEMTNLYAAQKLSTFKTNPDELLRFFGILLFSGYHHVPHENHYWSTSEDLSNNIVPQIMPRKRFRDIKTFFHLVDNLNLEEGKASKVAPFYRHLSKKFLDLGGVFSKHLSIDESMVPYYGHHSCKMFIRGKPIRFGYKVWMMCSPDGYPFSMELYTGAKDKAENVKEPTPLGTRVVKSLSSVVENPKEHRLYFDNFFTSYSLVKELTESGFGAIGTVRETRTGKCPLTPSKELGKKDRGTFDYRGDGQIVCVRWNDNNVVTVMSNCEGVLPTQTVSRYSSKLKQKISVQQPRMISSYNLYMGGVDVLDRLLSAYRPSLRSKKWWWNLFSNGLNMAVVAAWRLHCYAVGHSSAMTHLEFRRKIAMVAMKVGLTSFRSRKGGPSAPVLEEIVKADIGHHLSSTTQGRCTVCQKNTKKWCEICKKRMHETCYPIFHGNIV